MFDDPDPSAVPTPLSTDTLVDSVVILLGLTVVQRLIGFVRSILFCSWLDPGQLGLWDMAFGFLSLAAPLSVLAIPGTFGRYLEFYRQRGQLRIFLRRTTLACGGLSLASFVGILLARDWFSVLIFGSQDQAGLVILLAGCLITVIACNFLVDLLTALRNVRLASTLQLINSFAFAVLAVGLLGCWQCTAESVVLAYAGSSLIAAFWAVSTIFRTLRPRTAAAESVPQPSPTTHVQLFSRIIPFAGWVLLSSVLMNLFGVIDRYMILHFSRIPAAEALDVVGNYYSSRVVPLLLVTITTMIAAMVMPHLSHDWEAGRREHVVRRLRLILKLCGFGLYAGVVVVLLAAPLLFRVVLHNKFDIGEAVLPWILVYCTWFGLSMLMQTYLFCAEKAWLLSVALGCGLLLNIPLNLVLLPRLGLEGAVLSTTAANALSLGLICLFNHHLGFRLDNGARLVLVLPMLVCLGPWAALFGLIAVAAVVVFSNRLLTPEEKRLVIESVRKGASTWRIPWPGIR
jgi:O-antigen/teichoic acid export membrane protein